MVLEAYAARTATDWDRRAAGAGWVSATGSLVKADLSGFTRLSERLARSDVTGAEQLNLVLNDVFVALIEEALTRGGDVLQFGGDALLVWFEGPCHEARGVAAARAMQQQVSRRPAEQTPAGPVRLRMSAAVASGEVLLTVVGRDHRELLVLGPVATRVELLEKSAGTGEVLLDPVTARALDAGAAVPCGPDAWRSRRAPAEVRAERTPSAGPAAEAFVPPEVRALHAAGPVTGEHRRAAVAFVGVSGVDALAERSGAAAVVDRVRKVAAAVDEAVRVTRVAWTATDLMADGAVFLLFAGAPVAREDDEERILRACRLVAEHCADLGVRIGAHVGRVFAADIGHPERRTFAIIGDTTNLAARLMHRGAPDQVLVTDDLEARSERDHAVQWLEPFAVRGKRHPVRAGLLGPRGQAAARRRTHDLPLVGRTEERDRLRALVEAVAGGDRDDATLRLALTGEPGVGKSRLVEELVQTAEARGLSVLQVAGNVFDGDNPYGAARPALRRALRLGEETTESAQVAGRLAALTAEPELLSLLNLPLGLHLPGTDAVAGLDPEFLEARRNELLAEVLLAEQDRPVLAVAEDLHWLDRATVGLVEVLARRARTEALGVLVSSREAISNRLDVTAGWQTLTVPPLPAEEARRLALSVPGDFPVSDSELARRVEDSGGNPLFLRELMSIGDAAAGSLPTSAEEVIAARIDSLGPARRRLLRDASVGGAVQRLADLAAALGDPGIGRASTWTELTDFVTVERADSGNAEAVLRFRHELYRQSAYQGLAVGRRRAVHGAWSDHLLADGGRLVAGAVAPATVAVHLFESARFPEAWEWARRAARQARDGGALHDAVRLYDRAIAAGRRAGAREEELAQIHEELGDTAELAGLYERADGAFRSAARAGPPATVARRLVKRGTVLERQARYRAALGQLTRAERLVTPAPPDSPAMRVRAGLALRRSSVLHRLGRLRRAYDVAAEVAAMPDVGPDVDLRADRARALLRLEMIASEAGWPQRFDLGRQALEAFEGLDEDRDLACLLGNMGVTAFESDDWVGARRRYEDSMEVYRRAGDVLGAAIAANNVGEILCEQGDLAGAREVFGDARRVFRAAGHGWGVACTASALGRVAARSGDPTRARRLLQEAVTSLDAMGSAVFAADARVRQVEAALIEQSPQAARRAAEMVETLARMEVGAVLPLTASRYLALATAGDGDVATARRIAEDALARAVESRATHEESLLLDLVAGLEGSAGQRPSPELLQRRDRIWDQLGIRSVFRYPQMSEPPGARSVAPPG